MGIVESSKILAVEEEVKCGHSFEV